MIRRWRRQEIAVGQAIVSVHRGQLLGAHQQRPQQEALGVAEHGLDVHRAEARDHERAAVAVGAAHVVVKTEEAQWTFEIADAPSEGAG